MSESSSDFTERNAETKLAGLGAQYTPTEEERKTFKQCDTESFWYRSVPFSASAMALTHMLVINGKLTASLRFGSLPKVLFAGVCGYFAGKLSYMKTCQQKFYNLENSPIGEALRQRHRHPQRPPQYAQGPPPGGTFRRHMSQMSEPPHLAPDNVEEQPISGPQSEFMEDEKPQFAPLQSDSLPETPYSPPDFTYNDATHSAQHHEPPTHALRDEEQEVKRKPILYEELRSKNRENYDITRSQKIDRDPPKKEGESFKKNKYGDAWEE